jgi:hypothetical protein
MMNKGWMNLSKEVYSTNIEGENVIVSIQNTINIKI